MENAYWKTEMESILSNISMRSPFAPSNFQVVLLQWMREIEFPCFGTLTLLLSSYTSSSPLQNFGWYLLVPLPPWHWFEKQTFQTKIYDFERKKPGITWMDLIGFFKVPLTPYKSIHCLHSVHSHLGKVWHAIIYQLYTKLNVQYLTLKKSCAHVAKSKRNFGEIAGAPPFFLAKLHLFLLEELNYIDSNN